MHRRLVACMALSLVGIFLLACGGKVVVDWAPSDGGAGATTTTASGSGGFWTTTTSVTGTTSTSGAGGAGGAGVCYQTHESFALDVRTYWGESWGCDAGAPTAVGDASFEGVVMEAYEGYLMIDSCPPNADCMPMLTELHYGVPDPPVNNAPSLLPGTFIEVYVRVEQPWVCTHTLEIWNLPEWGGIANPIVGEPVLWLFGSEGTLEPITSLPYQLNAAGIHCYADAPSCGTPKDDYLLNVVDEFYGHQEGLLMGDTLWFHTGNLDGLVFTNLRSFESGLCDDSWNWAYYVARQWY